ncbi:MAG: hypothetical protein N2C14_31825 [Planctomycetales bacterium]
MVGENAQQLAITAKPPEVIRKVKKFEVDPGPEDNHDLIDAISREGAVVHFTSTLSLTIRQGERWSKRPLLCLLD